MMPDAAILLGRRLNDLKATTAEYGAFAPRGLVRAVLQRTRAAGPGWLSRRVAFLLRRAAIASLSRRPVDIEALGARMRLHPYGNVCEKRILFTPQFFDPDELSYIRARMEAKRAAGGEGFVFLDIGANIGGYSLFVAAHAGPGVKVLAIEPQPDIYSRLVFNLRLNAFASVKAVACAVADKEGELTLFVDSGNRGESSVKVMSGASSAESIKVPAKRLLTLIDEEGYGHVDVAKLDTEGAEDIILETFLAEAPRTLWPKALIMERGNNRWHVDLPALLAENGYRAVAETKNNVIYELAG